MVSLPARAFFVVAIVLASSSAAIAQSISAEVPLGSAPLRVATDQTTGRVYATHDRRLSIIDGATNTVERVVDIGGVGAPLWGLGVNESSGLAYVGNFVDIQAIDGASGALVARFSGGSNENSVAANPLTNRIYIGTNNCLTPLVNVFDGTSHSLVRSIPVDAMPLHIAVNTATNRVYVTKQYHCPGGNSTTLSVIDGMTNTEVATIPIGTGLEGVAVNPVTNRIYVANPVAGAVTVVDGDTHAIVASIALPRSKAVAVNATTGHVYVVTDELISAMDGATHTVIASSVGGGFHAAANSISNRIYVANLARGAVSVIEDPSVLTPDLAPPDWPEPRSLSVLGAGFSYATLGWSPAHDAYGVLGYAVYKDGVLVSRVPPHAVAARQWTVSGLAPCTTYTFKVEAIDPNGHTSIDGPAVTARTITPSESTRNVIDLVDALTAAGVLPQGHGNQLHQMLNAAANQLETGQGTGGVQLIEAVVRQVQLLADHGDFDSSYAGIVTFYLSEILATPRC